MRLAVTGAGPVVFRVTKLEAVLTGRFEPAALNGLAVDPSGLNSDIHAGRHSAHLITVMAKRAVAAALASA